MCGILGITGNEERALEIATQAMAHRGPDARGLYRDDAVSLAHNRLAIIDLDPRSTQPLWDADRKTCIVYNGEVYNFRELRDSLKSSCDFRTESDTEVLLHGYRKHGPGFASRLRGMYAYALYDLEAQEMILVRDHAGIKPLYYYDDGSTFAFASEVKALRVLLEEKGIVLEYDTEAIRLYWAFGYIPSPFTAFKNIRALPRSSWGRYDIRTGRFTVQPYEIDARAVETESELFSLIERKIMEHLVADVPVGLFFSGGTDSSIIASTLKKHGSPLQTFSISVGGRNADERYFRSISSALGLHARIFEFTPIVFDQLYEAVMRGLDIPIADNSIFPTYFVSKMAREHVTVVLSGEGGDELFFGYPRQRRLVKMRANIDDRMTIADRLVLALPKMKGRNKMASAMYSWLGQPLSFYIREMSPARDFMTREFLEPAKRFMSTIVHDALYTDREMYLENMLLRKTDVATMLNSLEGRVPLLDPDIIASAPHFESAYADEGGIKPVLKRMLARDIPHDLVYRPKSGFGMNPRMFFDRSDAMHRDLTDAMAFFDQMRIPVPSMPDTETLIEHHHNAAYAAIALYRALQR